MFLLLMKNFEKQTPFYAFSQILCAAANLSSSPSYGEVLALKHTYELEDEDDMVAADLDMHSLILTSNPQENSVSFVQRLWR